MIRELLAFMIHKRLLESLLGILSERFVLCQNITWKLPAPPICLRPGVFTGQTGTMKSASRLFTAKHNKTSLWPQDTRIQSNFLSSVKANNSPISSAAVWCRREYLPPEEPWNHVMCIQPPFIPAVNRTTSVLAQPNRMTSRFNICLRKCDYGKYPGE